jgi:DNA repair ATPase RecN
MEARRLGPASDHVAETLDSTSTVPAKDSAPAAEESKGFEVGGRSVDNNQQQSQNAVAVAEIFDSTKLFEDRFGKLLPAFEQVGNLGDEAAAAFESIKTLANNLERLTGAFEPLKSLQDQLALVASSFDPVSSLQGRFAEVSTAFRSHLKQLIGALQPAMAFHTRLVELATTFESASELQQRFERLAAAFDSDPHAAPSNGNGKASTASSTGPLA